MILLHSQVGQDLWGSYTIEILLWLLGAFLLGYILSYIMGAKYRTRVVELEKDLAEWKARANQFEADLSTARYEKEKMAEDLKKEKSKNADLYFKLKACEESKANLDSGSEDTKDSEDPDTSGGGTSGKVKNVANSSLGIAATNVSAGNIRSSGTIGGYAGAFTQDNLKVVEGIGPKIERLLKSKGIGTWGVLADSTREALSEILTEAGARFQIHDPKSWPEQAKLAHEGKWDDLIHYQKFMDSRKVKDSSSKVERLFMKAQGLKSYTPDDLKIVEGVGPKIEKLLKNGGINNWTALANSDIVKIQKILNQAGERYRLANPDTWPKQATLAAAGQWSQLKQYQDELQGGKK